MEAALLELGKNAPYAAAAVAFLFFSGKAALEYLGKRDTATQDATDKFLAVIAERDGFVERIAHEHAEAQRSTSLALRALQEESNSVIRENAKVLGAIGAQVAASVAQSAETSKQMQSFTRLISKLEEKAARR